jgi:hypothetical protein
VKIEGVLMTLTCQYVGLITTALVFVSIEAHAGERHTSVGPVDESCVVDVPNGATFHADTGEVSLDGAVVVPAGSCDKTWTAAYPPTHSEESAGGGLASGWVVYTEAHPITYEGTQVFDDLEESMLVPDAPSDYGNAGMQFFWCGLENLTSSGDWISVIQPELVWGDNQQEWVLQTQFVPNSTYLPGVKMSQSPQETVNPGDTFFCKIRQIATNEWDLYAEDVTTGAFSLQHYVLPGGSYGSSPYSWAQLAVYEVQNLLNCNGLPTQDYGFAALTQVQQAGLNWNAYYDVRTQITVTPHGSTGTGTCDYWAVFAGSPYFYSALDWSY